MTEAFNPQLSPPPAPDHPEFRARPYNRKARALNAVMFLFCSACALLVLGLLASIVGYILYRGAFGIHLSLFTNSPNDTPTGLRNAIAGTLLLIAAASLVGVPLGILCGVYLAEFAKNNPFTRAVRLIVDVLAGTPSIIVGVLAYELVVVPMGSPSGWAGVVALSFMMVPIISRTTEDMLKLVPKAYREASIGVGASRYQTLFRIVLPAGRAGVITGVMLAVARIAGETAPLYFTTLGSNLPVMDFEKGWGVFPQAFVIFTAFALLAFACALFRGTQFLARYVFFGGAVLAALLALVGLLTGWSPGLALPIIYFGKPYPTMTVAIYENVTSADNSWVDAAWAGMVILILIILVLNILVRYFSRQEVHNSH